jgi:hypothetical protein
VDSRNATAEIVVVHDVIVDKRERLDGLDRNRRREDIDLLAPRRGKRPILRRHRIDIRNRLGGQKEDRRAQTLAAGIEQIPRSSVESLGFFDRQLLTDRIIYDRPTVGDGRFDAF